MGTRPPSAPDAMPWLDRGDAAGGAVESPRSQRDLEILRSLARRIPAHDASAHNNLGVVYYNKGLYDEAIHHFEQALELDPRMQVAERNLQICYFGTGYLERLTSSLRTRLAADPSDDTAREQLARTFYNSGDIGAAVRELRALLHTRPADAQLHQRLARAELKRGHLDAALTALRDAELHAPDNARIKFLMGEALFQRGRSVEARDALERALALDEQLADAHQLLAFVYGDLNETERAQRAATRAAELNPSFGKADAGLSLDGYSTARYQELIGGAGLVGAAPEVAEGGELAHYNLGLAFRQKALYDEALREFRLAAERGEDSMLVQHAQAEMLLLRGDSAEALRLYRQLIQQESGSPKLWNELGVSHHQTGELLEAEQAYRRALEIDADYPLAWNNLGVVLHHRGQEGAEDALRSALRHGRVVADIARNLALMLHRDGRLEESEEAYGQALAASPSSPLACTGLGVLLLEQGRTDEARGLLLRAVEADPELAEARYHLGFALSALGDYDAALRETKFALELNPYIPAPRFRLMIDLQFEEASLLAPELDEPERVHGRDAVRSFHFHPGALDSLFAGDAQAGPSTGEPGSDLLESARTALSRGQLEQASGYAQRASLAGAERMEVLLLQGEIFLRRELSGEAIERFNAALAEIRRSGSGDQDDALRRALHGAARSLLDLGRMAEAIEAAERLCELAPGDVEGLRTLGDALARVGDHARAAIVLEQARLGAPDDINLLTQLGAAYAAAGDLDGAESALRRAIHADARAVGARVVLGGLLSEEGRFEEAEAEFRGALVVLPTYGAAAFGLSELEERRGRPQHAINALVDLLMRDPYHLDALLRLGALLERASQPQQARFAYERVLHFDPRNQTARGALDRTRTVRA
jgi:cellulose synthase operon protein C